MNPRENRGLSFRGAKRRRIYFPFHLGFGYIRRLKRTQYDIALSDTSLLYPGYLEHRGALYDKMLVWIPVCTGMTMWKG